MSFSYGFGVEELPASGAPGLSAQVGTEKEQMCLAAAGTVCVLRVFLSSGLCVHRCLRRASPARRAGTV